jgi:hypothetical protein
MSTQERRRTPRVQIDLPLQLNIGEETLDTRLSDISTSGVRFRTLRPLTIMSRVQIALDLPESGEPPVGLAGVVVRSDLRTDAAGNPDPDGGQYETAIFFDNLSEEALGQLGRFLERHGS